MMRLNLGLVYFFLDVTYAIASVLWFPKTTNQISQISPESRIRQDKLDPRRIFKDGSQTPDWCIETLSSCLMLF